MKVKVLAAAISLACTLSPSWAFAQEESKEEDSPSSLETILVTANFKEQSLQDTGVAMDAVSSEKLVRDNITNAVDLSTIVPSLAIANTGGLNTQLFMRGVGNITTNGYVDPAIVLTFDGVALARSSASSIGGFFDLQRIEVLKGPQGTLYGRNATGGVINLVPERPQLEETSGYASVQVGNYNSRQLQGALNLPVTKNSALRISANKIKRDGFNKDGSNDDDRTTVRLQYLWDIDDNFTFRIAADHTDIDGVGYQKQPVGSYDPDFNYISANIGPNEGPGSDSPNELRRTVLAAPGFGFLEGVNSDDLYIDATLKGVNAELTYSADDYTLTFIPAWRKTEQDSTFVGPGFNLGWWQDSAEQLSAELRVAGEFSDDIDYIVGAYIFDEELKGNNTFNQEFILPLEEYVSNNESQAIFGEITYYINDEHRLIIGGRYTNDDKTMQGVSNTFITFCGGLPPDLIVPPGSFEQGCATPGNLPHFPTFDTVEQANQFLIDNGWATNFIPIPPGFLIPLDNGVGQILHSISEADASFSDSKFTYKLSYEWDVTPDSLMYLSYSTGYRAGGLQPGAESPYESETINAWTLGSKNVFLDDSLQLNFEAFYWEYEDQQITYFNLDDNNVLDNTTENVGQTTNKGFDVDLLWKVAENTHVSAKLEYLKAEYEDLFFYTSPPRDNINCPSTETGTLPDGTPLLEFNCSGSTPAFSPEWSYQLGIEHTLVFDSVNVVFALDTRWQDDQNSNFFNLAHEVIDAYSTTNVNISIEESDGIWSVDFYAHNLEDEYRVASTESPLLGIAMAQYNIDMTYGARFTYNF